MTDVQDRFLVVKLKNHPIANRFQPSYAAKHEVKGEREEGREGTRREGANNLVSWRHVLSRTFRNMHGQQGASASVCAELRQHANRAKPASTQSCAGTRTEPSPHARRAVLACAQSHTRTRAEPRWHAHRCALALAIELCISTQAVISKLKKYQSCLKGKLLDCY